MWSILSWASTFLSPTAQTKVHESTSTFRDPCEQQSPPRPRLPPNAVCSVFNQIITTASNPIILIIVHHDDNDDDDDNTLYWEALPIYTIYQLCILESNQDSSQQIISIDQNHLSSDKIVSKKLLCLTNIPHIYPTAFCITFWMHMIEISYTPPPFFLELFRKFIRFGNATLP